MKKTMRMLHFWLQVSYFGSYSLQFFVIVAVRLGVAALMLSHRELFGQCVVSINSSYVFVTSCMLLHMLHILFRRLQEKMWQA